MASAIMRNFKFKLSIAGMGATMGFSKVSGLTANVEVIEYREGGDPLTMRKFPGQVSYDNVTLERGFTADSDLVSWIDSVYNPTQQVQTNVQRYDVTIDVLDGAGNTQRTFVLKNAFPASRQIGDLDATGNDMLIETLELAHEGIVEQRYDENGVRR